ncbi:hypothetical protein FQR65_LT07754 [Abscondita terminalis]|nr:hypothetical protein FQR65_LT07754 [Abscondita terminalis]
MLRSLISFTVSSKVNRGSSKEKSFVEGEKVVVKRDKTWEPVKIEAKLEEPRSYIVGDQANNLYRCNSAHIRKSHNEPVFQHHESASPKESEPTPQVVSEKRLRRKPVRFEDYVTY